MKCNGAGAGTSHRGWGPCWAGGVEQRKGWDGFKTWPEEEKEGGREAEVLPHIRSHHPWEQGHRSKRCGERGRGLHKGCAKPRYPRQPSSHTHQMSRSGARQWPAGSQNSQATRRRHEVRGATCEEQRHRGEGRDVRQRSSGWRKTMPDHPLK